MIERTIYLTEVDAQRLNVLLHGHRIDPRDGRHVQDLQKELRRGKIVGAQDIPKDLITMNSRVRIKDLDTGDEAVYTLVFPQDADIKTGKISVLAPIGTALLGYRAGDTIEWALPAGVKRLKVEEVLYQPEAAGDFGL